MGPSAEPAGRVDLRGHEIARPQLAHNSLARGRSVEEQAAARPFEFGDVRPVLSERSWVEAVLRLETVLRQDPERRGPVPGVVEEQPLHESLSPCRRDDDGAAL